VRANAAHGLPLKTKEKKAAARGLLARFPERSDRWIAEDAGLSHPTVTGLRASLEAGGKIYHLGYSVGQDGKRYPCDCPRCQDSARCRPAVEPSPDQSDKSDPSTPSDGSAGPEQQPADVAPSRYSPSAPAPCAPASSSAPLCRVRDRIPPLRPLRAPLRPPAVSSRCRARTHFRPVP
jgi:hypothetical protein